MLCRGIVPCLLEPTSNTQTTRFTCGRGYALRVCTSMSASCAIDVREKARHVRGLRCAGPDGRSPSIEIATDAVAIPIAEGGPAFRARAAFEAEGA